MTRVTLAWKPWPARTAAPGNRHRKVCAGLSPGTFNHRRAPLLTDFKANRTKCNSGRQVQCAPVLKAGADTELDAGYGFIMVKQLTTGWTFEVFRRLLAPSQALIPRSVPLDRSRVLSCATCNMHTKKSTHSDTCALSKQNPLKSLQIKVGAPQQPSPQKRKTKKRRRKTTAEKRLQRPPTLELRPPGFARDPSVTQVTCGPAPAPS